MPAEERDLLPPPPAAAGGFLLAVIFANGDLTPPPDLSPRLAAASLTLAADGGARHCRALGVRPHVVIGDLDSLGAAQQAELESQGAQIISHPADKDQTDLELALLAGAEGAGRR